MRLAGRRFCAAFAALALAIGLSGAVGPASAAETEDHEGRMFWVDTETRQIVSTDLDGNDSVVALPSVGVRPDSSFHLDYSAAQDRFYYTLTGSATNPNRLGWTAADGSGDSGLVDTGSLDLDQPSGIAIDPVNNRVWWVEWFGDRIASVGLDGSDAKVYRSGFLYAPRLLLDPQGGDLYWNDDEHVFRAPLDSPQDATPLNPDETNSDTSVGFSLDRRNGRLYWARKPGRIPGERLGWATVDGGETGNFVTTDDDFEELTGVAIDPLADRIYWMVANGTVSERDNAIFWQDLGDSTTHGKITGLGTAYQPSNPILIRAPVAVAPPTISGGTTQGNTLTCNAADWEEDRSEARFFVAPLETQWIWTRDGQEIASATEQSLIASEPGEYRCIERASNRGGESEATSAAHTVVPEPDGRMFWIDTDRDVIVSADLDGEGPVVELPSVGVTPDFSFALDYSARQNRFYYTLAGSAHGLGWTAADGSGESGLVDTGSFVPYDPSGIAVDPVNDRIWWAEWNGERIASVGMDGSDAKVFLSEDLRAPSVLLDPQGGDLYWNSGEHVFRAPLDSPQDATLLNPGETNSDTSAGFSLDRRDGRLYWRKWPGMTPGERLGWATADGGESGNFVTTDDNFWRPTGVAIDPLADRIYWMVGNGTAESGGDNAIFWQDLGDSSTHGKITGLGTTYQPSNPILIRAPVEVSPPAISGETTQGSLLTCNAADWEADHSEARFFVAPVDTQWIWKHDGQVVGDASSPSLIATEPGEYRCIERTANPGGESEAASAGFVVVEGEPDPADPPEPQDPPEVKPPTEPPAPEPGEAGAICPRLKLNLNVADFKPRPPYGRASRTLGLRARVATGHDTVARIQPRIRYRIRNGTPRVAWLKTRTIRINGARALRFNLPRAARRQMQRPLHGRPVALIIRARLHLQGVGAACRQDLIVQRLRTRVVGISARAALSRAATEGPSRRRKEMPLGR